MEAIQEMIRPELLVLIPVLYFIGMAVKKSAAILDKFIPAILGIVGIFLATVYVISTTATINGAEIAQAVFAGVTQGILCAGCSVYVNQLVKQSGKDEDA